MSNAINPDFVSATERLDELGTLLASALMRLLMRQSSYLSLSNGESSLDLSAYQSGHANALRREGGSA